MDQRTHPGGVHSCEVDEPLPVYSDVTPSADTSTYMRPTEANSLLITCCVEIIRINWRC